jgi:hypothetical protein
VLREFCWFSVARAGARDAGQKLEDREQEFGG